jgi:hypothetical protein
MSVENALGRVTLGFSQRMNPSMTATADRNAIPSDVSAAILNLDHVVPETGLIGTREARPGWRSESPRAAPDVDVLVNGWNNDR